MHCFCILTLVLASAGARAGVGEPVPVVPPSIKAASRVISPEGLLKSIQVLASDEFEGRAPGTPGEEKTVGWLAEQFRSLGLKPGNPDGSWTQDVPMVGITAQEPTIRFKHGADIADLRFADQGVIWSKRQVPEVSLPDSEVIYVGCGVVAPEYKWDDFKGVDVKGKTILVLINDPQVPSPRDPDELDPTKFKGRAMTYYGRWTYKFEEAARKGAAGVILIHEQAMAGYPWSVVVDSNSRENFDLQSPDKNMGRAAVEGWINVEQARKIFAMAGFDYESLKKTAANKEFKPVSLGLKADFSLKNQLRSVTSKNVVGMLEGSHRKLKRSVVVYSAHWDHLGTETKSSGTKAIYRGALDNASGVAGLIELAKAFRVSPHPPKRSILFLAPTAEEKGLLGARYYAQHPLYPIQETVADLNMDGLNPWGRTVEVEVIGAGNSTLEEQLRLAAATQKRRLAPESHAERGTFYRSDHFEFAKVGVPVLYFKAGTNYVGKPTEFGVEKIEDYVSHDYHKPSDSVRADWDLSGAVEDLCLLFQIGWNVSETENAPTWYPDSEFRRDKLKR